MSVLDKILDTAESLFNRHGYNSVGIDFIRDEAEVSKTTIYRHFSSKTELIVKVLRRRHARFQDAFLEVIEPSEPVEVQLRCLLDWHFDWFSSEQFEGCMFMHALSEFKKQEESIRKVAEEHKLWLLGVIQGIMGTDEEIKILRAEMVFIFLEGLIVRAEFRELKLPHDMYFQEVVRIANVSEKHET